MEDLNLMIKAQKMGRKKKKHLQQKQLLPAVKNLQKLLYYGKRRRNLKKKKKLLKSDFKTKAFETLFQNNSQLRLNLAFTLTDTLRT